MPRYQNGSSEASWIGVALCGRPGLSCARVQKLSVVRDLSSIEERLSLFWQNICQSASPNSFQGL
jgi:hypothetical protein